MHPPLSIGAEVGHCHQQRYPDCGEEEIDRVISGREKCVHDADYVEHSKG
jgi:hypothetical protein